MNIIKRKINKVLRCSWFMKHVIKAIWLLVNKRWYVFRDTPYLVVRTVALRKPHKDNQDVNNLILEAKKEVQLRRMNKQRNKGV